MQAGESIVRLGCSSVDAPRPRGGAILFSTIVADGAAWELSVRHELVKRFGARQDLGPDYFQGKVPHIRDCVMSVSLKHPMGSDRPLSVSGSTMDSGTNEDMPSTDVEGAIDRFLDSHLEPAEAHEFVTIEAARRLYLSSPGGVRAAQGQAHAFKRAMLRKLGTENCIRRLSSNGRSYLNAFMGYRLVDTEARDAVIRWLAERTQMTGSKEDAISLEQLWAVWLTEHGADTKSRSVFRRAYVQHFSGLSGAKYMVVSSVGDERNVRHVVRCCTLGTKSAN